MEHLPAVQQQQQQSLTAFSGPVGFEAAQRMAKALCSSTMVPEAYRGPENMGNAIIALEMAQRVGASPMAVMQNLHIIHGRPSWSSSFIIAALNSCGKFSPLRFRVEGQGDGRVCVAWANERGSGEVLEGPPASIEMAKAEGWYTKNGSKWKTMPDLMLRYRAAAFFGRLYAPDILMGMHSEDEVEDIGTRPAQQAAPVLIQPEPAPAPEPAPEPEQPLGDALKAARTKARKSSAVTAPEPVQAEPEPEPVQAEIIPPAAAAPAPAAAPKATPAANAAPIELF